MSAPPAYDDVAGPSSGHNAEPPAHNAYGNQSGKHNYPSAAEEKAQVQQAMHASTLDTGEKRLKIWHAASGNSLVTAADEKTPIYNVIDSRAPNEAEQRQRSAQVQQKWEAQQRGQGGGMSRQDPASAGVPDDVRFAQEIAHSRQTPAHVQPQPHRSALWTLEVRRGGSRQSEPIATIKRHINTRSAVSITLHGQQTGIEQHAGIPHTKYSFNWEGKRYNWTRTRKAPGTSALDSGNFVCRDESKTVFAWSTDDDSRCDGSLIFENRTIEAQLLDIMMVTGFVMRDLEDERNNPSYMRYGGGGGYGYGYGPYASPYASNYGFYPTPLFFPLLL